MDTNIKNDKGKPLRPTTLKRRREILDAALECFLENGVEGTSIEQIRNKSGASHGSIYHLFKSKGEIAFTLYVEGLERYHQEMLTAMQRESGCYEKIKAIIKSHFEVVVNEPKLVLYITRLSVSDMVFEEAGHNNQVKTDFPAEIHNDLLPFIQSGEIQNLDPHFYYPLIVGPSAALSRRWLKSPGEFDLLGCIETVAKSVHSSIQNNNHHNGVSGHVNVAEEVPEAN